MKDKIWASFAINPQDQGFAVYYVTPNNSKIIVGEVLGTPITLR